MQTYLALLHGINVSGHKMIKMDLLRKALLELDFKIIATYIQSGNIIFESSIANSKGLEKSIADKIYQHFGFDVPVTVLLPKELKSVIDQNPFSDENLADPKQPYVAFLSNTPVLEDIKILQAINFGRDKFVTVGKTLYIWYADSAGNTKLTNSIIENKLKLKATSRNWKTVLKLYELATQMTK